MPNATRIAATENHALKTLPEGFVEVRRLSYGQKLERKAMSSMATVEGSKRGNMRATMQMINEAATLFDFRNCIVDHNLEDENGNKLDLTKQSDIRRLDPRVGDEIESILDKLNNFEEEDEEGNSEGD
jgi:hypothetical protein